VVIGAPLDLREYCQEGLSRQQQLQQLTDRLEKTVYDLKDLLN
jgi:hypothetical protein